MPERRLPARAAQRALSAVGLVALLTAAVLLPAVPAQAHPWGPPPTAVVAVDGSEIAIEWQAEPDDAVALGVALELLDPARIDWQWDGPANVEEAAVDGRPLEEAPALHFYLLDRIRVHQDGVACRGAVHATGDFLAEGARVVHHCPGDIDVVTVRITMLQDLHEAYRTFAHVRGEARPGQQVFTVANPEHRWEFGASGAAAGRFALAGSWSQPLAALLLTAGALGAALRQRRRRTRG